MLYSNASRIVGHHDEAFHIHEVVAAQEAVGVRIDLVERASTYFQHYRRSVVRPVVLEGVEPLR